MNQGWFVGVTALVILLSGCGKEKGEWNSFPLEIYADKTIAQDPEKAADFEAALAFWEAKAGRKLFNYQGMWTGGSPFSGAAGSVEAIAANVMFYMSPWPFSETVAGQTTSFQKNGAVQSAVIMINPDMHFCSGDCKGAWDTTSQRNTYAHELGHFIGMNHVTDSANIMNPTVLTTTDLTAIRVDSAALQALTGK